MNFNIDWIKTKSNIKMAIKEYIYSCLSVDKDSFSKVDEDYCIPLLNNAENNYIQLDKDKKNKRIEIVNNFRVAFNKLTTEERKLIYWAYLDKEDNYDDRFIANALGFSLGYYYIKKKEALIRFAYALGIEVV